jgi:pyruvate,orthophosphate dikinase
MSDVLDKGEGRPVSDTRYVYDIAVLDRTDGRLFGGKATGLARMASAGIPVPPAFAISTDAFRAWYAAGKRLPDALAVQLDDAIALLNEQAGRPFAGDGSAHDPLLVSVRSGAQVSMPGMMDTVLNLGLDARSADAMIARTGRRAFVIDTWMRFWKMYAEIVLGLDGEEFVDALAPARVVAEVPDGDLTVLETAVVDYIVEQGEEAPTDPRTQLDRAIAAVFSSWNSPRAKAYRDHQCISHDLGTAVTVQAMVFGNVDDNSGSGVAFSRNPNTGEAILYGEYLAGRQGEDIVSGTSTPVDLATHDGQHEALRNALSAHSHTLEALYGDAVDIEFTLEADKLYLLQVRPAKRTAAAAVRIATDLVAEGLLAPAGGLKLVTAEQVKRLLRPVFDSEQRASAPIVATGIGSSPGQASGVAVLDSDRAAERVAGGEAVILVRPTTSPLDIRGMLAANGILTAKGGALSHAAVVSRALDKPCIVGCQALVIDVDARSFVIDGNLFQEGDAIAIDGTTGQIYGRALDLATPESGSSSLPRLLEAADALSQAQIWVNSATESPANKGVDAIPGVAVINLADVAIAQGLIGRLVEGVTALGQGNDPAGEMLSAVTLDIGKSIVASTRRPVHVRFPQPGSSRARFLIQRWPELDQRLFLPLGNPAFQRAMLNGLAGAVAGSKASVTALLGGVTDVAEWQRYQAEVALMPTLSAGLVIQNAAGLEAAPAMVASRATLWIDLDEVAHSAHGFLPKAYISNAVLDDYVSQGLMTSNPHQHLRPFLAVLLDQLIAVPGAVQTVGILCSSDVDPDLVRVLYGKGFRRFSVPPGQRDMLRLVLGQAVGEQL